MFTNFFLPKKKKKDNNEREIKLPTEKKDMPNASANKVDGY